MMRILLLVKVQNVNVDLKKTTMTIAIVIGLMVCISMKLLMTVFVMKVNGICTEGNVNKVNKWIVLTTGTQ